MIMVTQIPITEEGLEKLKEELKRLKSVDRPQIIEAIADARALGDLSENAEYHSAREKQGFIEGRIQELEDKVTRCQVIYPPQSRTSEKVVFGARIKIKDVSDDSKGETKVYRIVGDLEADIKALSISVSSPLAKSLLNKAVGDIVTVNLPKGEREYEVIDISF
jgi:transcription elongation factor GreA